jgi:hypothetical protein
VIVGTAGVVALPEHVREATIKLMEDYVKDEHTLVCCVVQASLATVKNSLSLGVVHRCQRGHKTILVLSKLDRVAPCDMEDQVVDRIKGTSDQVAGLVSQNVLLNPKCRCVGVGEADRRGVCVAFAFRPAWWAW